MTIFIFRAHSAIGESIESPTLTMDADVNQSSSYHSTTARVLTVIFGLIARLQHVPVICMDRCGETVTRTTVDVSASMAFTV